MDGVVSNYILNTRPQNVIYYPTLYLQFVLAYMENCDYWQTG
jgi:hypothetical protein